MTIEISKKQIITTTIAILVIVTFSCGSYFIGYHKGEKDTVASYENKKGNGENFYSEEINGTQVNAIQRVGDYIIYHSTPNCEAIRNGVSENRGYTDSLYRENHSTFCPKCMDEKLIKKCQSFLSNGFK